MRFMIREIFHSQRGKAQEIVEALKGVNQMLAGMGCTNGKISVDLSGPPAIVFG